MNLPRDFPSRCFEALSLTDLKPPGIRSRFVHLLQSTCLPLLLPSLSRQLCQRSRSLHQIQTRLHPPGPHWIHNKSSSRASCCLFLTSQIQLRLNSLILSACQNILPLRCPRAPTIMVQSSTYPRVHPPLTGASPLQTRSSLKRPLSPLNLFKLSRPMIGVFRQTPPFVHLSPFPQEVGIAQPQIHLYGQLPLAPQAPQAQFIHLAWRPPLP